MSIQAEERCGAVWLLLHRAVVCPGMRTFANLQPAVSVLERGVLAAREPLGNAMPPVKRGAGGPAVSGLRWRARGTAACEPSPSGAVLRAVLRAVPTCQREAGERR